RAAAGLARLLRLARSGPGHRRRRDARDIADADPGDRLAAGAVRVLAVEGLAAPAEGDDGAADRRARRQAVWVDRGRVRTDPRRARQRGADLQGKLRLRRGLPAGDGVG